MAPNRSDSCSSPDGAAFFVSTDGDDAWSGTLAKPNDAKTDGPFATLFRAREAVRERMASGPPPSGITVQVRAGKYYLSHTFILSPQDGGTQESPVTYAACSGETPVLSGGARLTDWKPHKGNILQCPLPGARGGKCKFRQLFLNGKRMIRARYPKVDPQYPLYGGWAFTEGPAADGPNPPAHFLRPRGFSDPNMDSFEGGVSNAFGYKAGTFKNHWAKPSEGEVFCWPGPTWGNNIIPIQSVDEAKRVITLVRDIWQFDRSHWYRWLSFLANNRFYVENLLEELTEPGEWCCDSEDGIVYFWPPEGSLGKDDEVLVPRLRTLVSIRGASSVRLSGLTFTETLDGDDTQRDGLDGYGAMFPRQGWTYCGEAVHLRRTRHCRVEDCRFDGVGGNAVYLELDCIRSEVRRNEIVGAGANGVCVIGTFQDRPMFNEITDNHIHHCGVINKYIAGIFMGMSDGTLVAHNSIHEMPHHAINLATNGAGRNILEYNDLRRVALEVFDTGAINCWMDMSTAGITRETERCGHIIRYNLIADTLGRRVDESGHVVAAIESTSGVYLDDCTSNCMVYGNIFVRVGQALNVHLGKNNIIENNIAVDCKSLIIICDTVSRRPGNAHMADFMTGIRTCRNIFYTRVPQACLFDLRKWTDKQIGMSDENLFFSPTDQEFRIVGTAIEQPLSLEQWRKMGYDLHTVIADPLFADLERDDFSLKPDSPAFKLGFQPIDVSRIGIRKGKR